MAIKKYILRCRASDRNIFDAIKSGAKKVETRAATVRYKNMQAGDLVEVVCGKDRFKKEVKSAKVFSSVGALLKQYPLKSIMPDAQSSKDLYASYRSFPGYEEKIKKFGLVALEL